MEQEILIKILELTRAIRLLRGGVETQLRYL